MFHCIFAQVCLAVGPLTHLVDTFSALECMTGIEVLSNWWNPIVFPYYGRKSQVEVTELLLPKKIVNQKQYPILGDIT